MTSHTPNADCQKRAVVAFGLLLILFVFSGTIISDAKAQVADDYEADGAALSFEIRGYEVSGNSVLQEYEVYNALKDYTGKEKLPEDVEAARDKLESLYHKKGYPTILVNIPEQTIDDGLVRLEVIESRIRWVTVTGNRYFTREKIMAALPSFTPGTILHVPAVKNDLARLNIHPDFKVSPVLKPARELGFIDVELQVEDRLPLHGEVEINNRSTYATSDLRVNTMLRYENLWQKEHSFSLQYQTAPEEPEEVQVLAASYVLPSPWVPGHLVALFGVMSDSESSFGEGFHVVGEGNLVGARYVMPLGVRGDYNHTFTIGLDYKDFDETLGFAADEDDPDDGSLTTPITYLPLSFSYNGFDSDEQGMTRYSCGLNMAFRGVVTDQDEFEIKRYKARGNYLYATLGVERKQKLPWGMGLFVKADGQIASEPLISNEQYAAGGMESVRGYKENEAAGDDALHGTLELSAPDLGPAVNSLFKLDDTVKCIFYGFYDYARLMLHDPLEGQDKHVGIKGAGLGVRGRISRHLTWRVDWGTALDSTDNTEQGDYEVHFQVKAAL